MDKTLLLLRHAYQQDPDHFNLHALAEEIRILSDVTIDIGIFDANGNLTSRTTDAPTFNISDREFFRLLASARDDRVFIDQPITTRLSHKVAIPVARRIQKSDGSFAGVLAAAVDPTFVEAFHKSLNLGAHSNIIVRGLDGVVRTSFGFEKPPIKTSPLVAEALARARDGHLWGGGAADGVNRLVSYRTVEGLPLIVAIGETEEHIFAEYGLHRTIYIAVASILTFLALIVLWTSIRRRMNFEGAQQSMIQTNERLNAIIENISHGIVMIDGKKSLVICNSHFGKMYHLPSELLKPGTPHGAIIAHRVEHGILAGEKNSGAVAKKLDALGQLPSDRIASRVDELGDGRLVRVTRYPMKDGGWVATHEDITERASRAATDRQRAEIDAAIKAFRETAESNLGAVIDSSTTLRSIAGELSTSSVEASNQTDSAVHEAKSATANVSSAATAAVQLQNSISEITERLNKAAGVARSAVAETHATNKEIGQLAEAVQKIGDIIEFIQDIAEQTNLLALNATIEAARAGEAGKGFSVVASEVKSLAVQTAKATEEIAAQIKSVQGSTDSSVGAIRQITKRVQEIDEYASAIALSIGQQRDATSEITQNVVSAAEGTKIVSSTLAQVAGAIVKTGASASTVLVTTEAVETAATNLREKVEDFLRKVAV